MKQIAISLALWDIYGDGGRGKLKRPLNGAVARFWALEKELSSDALIICSAGYCKPSPLAPMVEQVMTMPEQIVSYVRKVPRWLTQLARMIYGPAGTRLRCVSLADQLVRYVAEHAPQWSPRLVARPVCWSTGHEVRMGVKFGLHTGFVQEQEQVEVLIASHPVHFPRLWLFVKLYMPRTWHVRFLQAQLEDWAMLALHEIPKLVWAVFQVVKIRWRFKRYQKHLNKKIR